MEENSNQGITFEHPFVSRIKNLNDLCDTPKALVRDREQPKEGVISALTFEQLFK